MNTFVSSPGPAMTVARETIADRVQDAERRRDVRAVRAERRAARAATRTAYDPTPRRRPGWVFRFANPVH